MGGQRNQMAKTFVNVFPLSLLSPVRNRHFSLGGTLDEGSKDTLAQLEGVFTDSHRSTIKTRALEYGMNPYKPRRNYNKIQKVIHIPEKPEPIDLDRFKHILERKGNKMLDQGD